MSAQKIFNQLKQIKFDNDDSNNPHTEAGNIKINQYIDQAISLDNQKIAHYIGPTNYAYNSDENIIDIAKHICKRKDSNGSLFNNFYNSQLDKPFIIIANTKTVLAKYTTDVNHSGGEHWIGWVLLPKTYYNLEKEEKGTGKYQLFFFDSLGQRLFPEKLKQLLLSGGTIKENSTNITLVPFCKPNEIDFKDCSHLTGQQVGINGADCGWWAAYYVLMTIYTGSIDFLTPLRNKKLSALPLRNIMDLADSVPESQAPFLPKPPFSTKPNQLPPSASNPPRNDNNFSSSLEGHNEYSASGLKKTLHGNIYQLKLLMFFLRRALDNGYSFWLATEMEMAGKFDDVVLKYTNKNRSRESQNYRFLQAKHKYDESEIIKVSDLLTEKDEDFSLQKYFLSFTKLKRDFQDGEIKDLIICTNINFEFNTHIVNSGLNLKDVLTVLKDEEEIFNIPARKKQPIRYQFIKKHQDLKTYIYPILKKTSNLIRLAKKLAECVFKGKKIELRDELFKQYHIVLVTSEIIDLNTKKLHQNFISGNKKEEKKTKKARNLIPSAEPLRKAFLQAAEDYIKIPENVNNETYIWQEASKITLTLSGSIGISQKNDIEATDLPNDYVSDKDIEEFLSKLVFAVNQPNEKELGEAIAQEINNDFNLVHDTFVASEFQREMLDWMKNWENKKGKFLSNEDGKAFFTEAERKLSKLILIGPSLEYQQKLKETGLVFNAIPELDNFLNSNNQVFHLIAKQSTRLTAVKVCQALKAKKTYQPDDSCLVHKLSSCLRLKEKLIEAYTLKNSAHLLVIECNIHSNQEKFSEIFASLRKILRENSNKRLVFITDNQSNYVELFNDLKYIQAEDGRHDFDSLDIKSKERLQNKEVVFRDRHFQLKEIIPTTELSKIIGAEDLLELASDNEFIIDNSLVKLNDFEEACYIPRQLLKKIIIKKECLQASIPDVFAISGIEQEMLITLIPKQEKTCTYDQIDTFKDAPIRFIVLEHKSVNEQFKHLAKKYSNTSIHLLNFKEDKLDWQHSHGTLTNLRQYLEESSINEYQPKDLVDQISIIAAEPGMGKSTFITHLTVDLQNTYAEAWIIKVDLVDCKTALSKIEFNSRVAALDFLSIIAKLSSFAKKLLDYYLNQSGKVVLLLDGFDELAADEQGKFINFLKILQTNTVAKVIITTRLHMREQLENELSIFAYSLKPLSQKEQKDFLQKYWLRNLMTMEDSKDKIETYTEALVKLFSQSIQDQDHQFMGIPLQAKMLAEAFEDDVIRYCTNTDKETGLPNTLNILELYQRFIDKKFEVYFKQKIHLDTARNFDLKTTLILTLTKIHRYFAFKLLFPQYVSKLIPNEEKLTLDMTELKRVGIVLWAGEQYTFVHRTFSEYLTADFLVNILKKPSDHPKYRSMQTFIAKEVFKERNQVIRGFIERRVAQEDNQKLTLIWQNINERNLMNEDTSYQAYLSITYDVEEIDLDENGLLKQIDIEKLLEQLDPSSGYVSWNEDSEIVIKIFNAIHTNSDSKIIEKALAGLHRKAIKTNFNKFKELVLNYYSEASKHYISCCFAECELGKEPVINYDLLVSFANIKPFAAPSSYSMGYEKSVDHLSKEAGNQVNIYKKLNQMRSNPPQITTEILSQLSEATILFLRVSNTIFSDAGFNIIKQGYEIYKGNENFRALLLQVDKDASEIAKLFLIEKEEWNLLIKLFNKFTHLKLTDQNVKDIYSNKKLLWLESFGVTISYAFRKLNSQMAEIFIGILNVDHINGYHTNYSNNIFYKYISPVLNLLFQKESANEIDNVSLLKMITCFIRFGMEHNLTYSLDSKQLVCILELIENTLNNPKISGNLLLIGLDCLMNVLKAAKLKIINTQKNILVLNPVNEFEYELKLSFKEHILNLIQSNLTKSRDGFVADCNKIAGQIILRTENMINIGIFNPRIKSKTLLQEHKEMNDFKTSNRKSFESPF